MPSAQSHVLTFIFLSVLLIIIIYTVTLNHL